MDITENALIEYGFTKRDLGDESPYEIFEKADIEVWDYNGLYWIVDVLDQAGIDRKFKTMEQLGEYFKACGRTWNEQLGKNGDWQMNTVNTNPSPQIVIDDLTEQQAMALAQFVKRVGWQEIRQNAVDDDEAYLIRDGIGSLQNALAEKGFAPR